LECGAISGVAQCVVCYPLQITRTRLGLSEPGTYNGIIDCIRKIVTRESPTALYAGLVPAVVGIIPYAAVEMGMFNQLRDTYIATYN
jgi:hypothetical protein